MIDPNTYLEFHAVVFLGPIAVLGLAAWARDTAWWDRQSRRGLVGVIVLAVIYTVPWSILLAERGVWEYADTTVVAQILQIPIGEYLFVILHPVVVALWLYQFIDPADVALSISRRQRLWGLLGGGVVAGIGGYMLVQSSSALYLGAILAWTGPVLAVQWAFGWPYLLRIRRQVTIGVVVPAAYLSVAGWLASTRWGLWSFSERLVLGSTVGGIPLEQPVFFVLVTLIVVQMLVLWMWVLDQLGRLEHSTEFVPRPAQFDTSD